MTVLFEFERFSNQSMIIDSFYSLAFFFLPF